MKTTQFTKGLLLAVSILAAFSFQAIQAQSNLISGKVFLDPNFNGVYDAGEVVSPLSTINLYNDVNGDEKYDEGDAFLESTVSDISGDYSFAVVPSGGLQSFSSAQASDDGEQDGSGVLISGDDELDLMGEIIGLRFVNVNIPQGAQIISAYVTFTAQDPGQNLYSVNIYGEDVDNASTFTTASNNISSRAKTTAFSLWTGIESWTVENQYSTPSIISVVQEIVDRAGWNSGNNLNIIVDKGIGTRRGVYTYEQDAAKSPKLFIQYAVDADTSKYVIVLEDAILSPDLNLSTSKYQTASFVGTGNTDINNDFAYVGSVSTCFAVSDGSDELYRFNRITGKSSLIGSLGAFPNVEAIALSNHSDTLYATNAGTFGWIDITSGAFTTIGTVGSSANGSAGSISLNDIDGLSYDRGQGIMWASHRRSAEDVLLQINVNTGAFVKDAFGLGVDYLVFSGFNNGHDDIDDIAIDNTTGKAYVVSTNNVVGSNLYEVDLTSGAMTFLGQMNNEDIEALGIDSEGELMGTSGGSVSGLFTISKTGVDNQVGTFSSGSDFEACDCLSMGGYNLISGVVFNDNNNNIIYDPSEDGVPNIEIILFDDANLNGINDEDEPIIQSMLTSANGSYAFTTSEIANYALAVNLATMPTGSSMTTDNMEYAQFASLGQTSSANNFGMSGGALPIELINFDAFLVGGKVEIVWTTAVEVNNDHFVVEKSANGNDFTELAFVYGQGNSYALTNYQELDVNPAFGINYYRLRQVDFDGSITYSSIRAIEMEVVKASIKVYPTVGSGLINVDFDELNASTAIQVLNINGQVVHSLNTNSIATRVNISHLPNGVYFVAFENGLENGTKIIKQ